MTQVCPEKGNGAGAGSGAQQISWRWQWGRSGTACGSPAASPSASTASSGCPSSACAHRWIPSTPSPPNKAWRMLSPWTAPGAPALPFAGLSFPNLTRARGRRSSSRAACSSWSQVLRAQLASAARPAWCCRRHGAGHRGPKPAQPPQGVTRSCWSRIQGAPRCQGLFSAHERSVLTPLPSAGRSGAAEQRGGSQLVPCPPGPAWDVPAAPLRARRQPHSRQRAPSPAGRTQRGVSPKLTAPLGTPPRAGGRARARRQREGRGRRGDSGGDMGVCPICSGRFSLDLLPVHASRCGEEDPPAAWPPSPLPGPSSPPAWVSCPICELPFGAAEVERHASSCGEPVGAPGSPSSFSWLG
ncbi:protein XNDC1N isoform X5 [Strix uralensis]|uniref:protein XNDC1N isoform X5 n=1 Tax=Strix uralensis TaxID=36305 RepID=UPI003DA7674E